MVDQINIYLNQDQTKQGAKPQALPATMVEGTVYGFVYDAETGYPIKDVTVMNAGGNLLITLPFLGTSGNCFYLAKGIIGSHRIRITANSGTYDMVELDLFVTNHFQKRNIYLLPTPPSKT